MRTIHDLVLTLEDQQNAAPSAHGLLEAASTQARRIKTRCRLSAASAALAVAAIAGITVLAPGQGDGRQSPSWSSLFPATAESPTPTVKPRARLMPGLMTIGLVQGSKYFALMQGVHDTKQKMVLRARPGEAVSFGADVTVHDPGSFSGSAFLEGQQVAIPGKPTPGYFLSSGQLGWQHADGSWVVLSGDNNREGLIRALQDIVFQPVYSLKSPYQFTYVPLGLVAAYASVRDAGGGEGFSSSGGGMNPPGTDADIDLFSGQAGALAISWMVAPRDQYLDSHTPALKDAVKVNANNVWYLDGSNAGGAGLSLGSGAGAVIITSQHCYALINIRQLSIVPRAEQEKLAAGFTFADCRKPDKWIAPFG